MKSIKDHIELDQNKNDLQTFDVYGPELQVHVSKSLYKHNTYKRLNLITKYVWARNYLLNNNPDIIFEQFYYKYAPYINIIFYRTDFTRFEILYCHVIKL